MRILCAPDSFKESINAADAAQAMALGVGDAGFTADVCPIADGGEGSLDTLLSAMGGEMRTATVVGPLGEPITARYGIAPGNIGIVELAEASGLALVPRESRNPARTTTFGTGQLIRLAADHGCNEVLVCIGGSATVDGGTGLAQALGAVFFSANGQAITSPMSGSDLAGLTRVQPPDARGLPTIRIACDVTNPLCGPRGAAAVYGPQKGATPEQVQQLDAGLAHLASLCGVDPATPGFGAAGGAAIGLVALCGGRLERGIELVLDAVGFQQRCHLADLVLTGEGCLDEQSLSGKASLGVARAAAECGVPTIAIVGKTGKGVAACVGAARGQFRACVSLSERYGEDRSMREPAALLRAAARDVALRFSKEPRSRRAE